MEGDLDKNRKLAVENYLDQDQKLKAEFLKLKEQVSYLEEISKIEPNAELVKFLSTREEGIASKIKNYKWEKWPSTVQWAAQLTVVGILLVVTIQLFPWLNLARSLKNNQISFLVKKAPVQDDDILKIGSRIVYGPFWPKEFPEPENYAKQQLENKIKNDQIADIVAKTDEEHNLQSGEEEGESTAKSEGFVWRGVLKVPELNNETAIKISSHIMSLGGAKAGQVELGWVKGDSRYYHFTIPIDKYTDFQNFMGEQGKLELKKEKHPRVMKDGTMRVIMSVEAAK